MGIKTSILTILSGAALVYVGAHSYRSNRAKWLPTSAKLTTTFPITTNLKECINIGGQKICTTLPSLKLESLSVDLRYSRIVHVSEPLVIVLVQGNNPAISQEDLAGFQFLLSVAGTEVQPKDWLTISEHGIPAKWSVVASDPGTYLLVLNVRRSGLQADSSARPFEFNLPSDKVLVVRGTFTYYTTKLWPYAVAVLGTFITLPGLIGLFKEARKKKQPPIGFVT